MKSMKRDVHLILGPVIAAGLCCAMLLSGLGWPVAATAGVTLLVAWWWVTEPISIPATALIPLAAFPLLGILDSGQAAQSLGSPLVQMMLGGFLLSAAMEKSGAHRRIALLMVNLFGGSSGRRLVFGFMAASALLSMWISNSATALMLLPIAMAVVEQSENKKFHSALLIGIAYACSIGGIVTPIGTPPNLVFMEVYQQKTGNEIAFLTWMGIGLPIAIVMLPAVSFWLTRSIKQNVEVRLPSVGQWRPEEIRTLGIFAATILLWISRKQPFGGWSQWTGMTEANDASIALMGSLAMFLVSSGTKKQDGSMSRLLDWEAAKNIPWGILILFAGGICIAKAFEQSGLSQLLGDSFGGLAAVPIFVLVLLICLAITFLTELTSNTATTTLLMPILAAMALSNQIDPLILMVPATLSASFAFMLPVATPPNAIVFGSQRLTVKEMAREGIVLNLVGAVVISVFCWWRL